MTLQLDDHGLPLPGGNLDAGDGLRRRWPSPDSGRERRKGEKQLCMKLVKGYDDMYVPVNDERDVECGLIALVNDVQCEAIEDRHVGQEWTVVLVELAVEEVEALEEWDGWGQ